MQCYLIINKNYILMAIINYKQKGEAGGFSINVLICIPTNIFLAEILNPQINLLSGM